MALTKQTISTEEQSTFGARLRWARDEQGLSRSVLSKRTEGALSARVIDHLESGTTDATGPRVEVLAKALGVDRNWLMFGEPDMTNHQNDNPDSAPDDEPDNPDDVPEKALEALESTPDGPKKALGALGALATERVLEKQESASASEGSKKNSPHHAANDDAANQYFDAMSKALSYIDWLREDGLEKHPRKLPKLIEKAIEIGQCLEQSDFKELADIRNAAIAELSEGILPEELLAEVALRLIDTALLGLDLYDLDMDALEAFAKKAEVDEPFLGWKSLAKIVRSVRSAYWSKALKGGLSLTKSLRHLEP